MILINNLTKKSRRLLNLM